MIIMEGDRQYFTDFRVKRQQFSNTIRKEQRNQVFLKHRNKNYSFQHQQHQEQDFMIDPRYQQYIRKFFETRFRLDILQQLKQSVNSDDIIKKHYGMIGIRRIISLSDDPPIQKIIDAGIIPKLIQYVQQEEFPQLQLQAAWSLTTIASGTHQQCQSIVDKGVIPLLIKLLKSSHTEIVEQAVWAIGNIASDSVGSRDKIINQGGVQNIIQAIESARNDYIFVNSLWALSNLCRGSPRPKYKSIRNAISLLGSILVEGRLLDASTINDVMWAISYNINLEQERIDDLFKTGFQKIIVRYLTCDSMSIKNAMIKIVARLTSMTSNKHLPLVYNQPGILDALCNLVSHKTKSIRALACETISNLISIRTEWIEELIKRQKTIGKILTLFESDCSEVAEEICYIFSNIAKNGEPKLVFNFFEQIHIIKYFLIVLQSDDQKLIKTGLSELEEILKFGQKFKIQKQQNPFVSYLLADNGYKILEDLELHEDKEIYESVVSLIQVYFEKEDPLKS